MPILRRAISSRPAPDDFAPGRSVATVHPQKGEVKHVGLPAVLALNRSGAFLFIVLLVCISLTMVEGAERDPDAVDHSGSSTGRSRSTQCRVPYDCSAERVVAQSSRVRSGDAPCSHGPPELAVEARQMLKPEQCIAGEFLLHGNPKL